MAEIIAVTNQAGGCGKTTTSINLTGGLARDGDRVLLTDTDPQGTATEGVGMAEAHTDGSPHLRDVLTDVGYIEEEPSEDIRGVIRSHPEFDVLPSNQHLTGVEHELQRIPKTEERLSLALQQIEDEYEYIVIDCEPHLGALTNNALVAADHLLIPAEPKRRSIRALERLSDQITFIEKHYTPLQRLGIVINDVDYPLDNDSSQMLEWFGQHFEEQALFEVRNRVAISRAWNNGVSIFEHEEDCDMEAVYEDLTDHVRQVTAEEVA